LDQFPNLKVLVGGPLFFFIIFFFFSQGWLVEGPLRGWFGLGIVPGWILKFRERLPLFPFWDPRGHFISNKLGFVFIISKELGKRNGTEFSFLILDCKVVWGFKVFRKLSRSKDLLGNPLHSLKIYYLLEFHFSI